MPISMAKSSMMCFKGTTYAPCPHFSPTKLPAKMAYLVFKILYLQNFSGSQ